jgi:hypothetical protein
MKGLRKAILAILVAAACGRDGAITEPKAPKDALLPPPTVFAPALGVDSTTGASIETNQDDYSPGEIVHLVGRGWAAGETVNLHMTEQPDTHADVDTNVVADASGGFSIHFYDVQPHDLGVTFTLSATGLLSNSRAVAVFTDGATILTIVSITPASPAPGASFDANISVDINGSAGGRVWRGTKVWIDAGPQTCFNTTDHVNTNGVFTEIITGLLAPGAGPHTLHMQAYEEDGCVTSTGGIKDFAFTVSSPSNAAPTVDAGSNKSVAEGTGISLGGAPPNGASASDPDGDALTLTWTVDETAMDAGAHCVVSDIHALAPTVTCDDDSNAGTVKLTLTADDGNGHVVSDFLLLTVTNANPSATASATPNPGNEGSSIQLNGGGDDPGNHDDAQGLTFEWSVDVTTIDAGGACNVSSTTAQNPTVTCTDDGTFPVTLKVRDDDGGLGTTIFSLVVNNAAPVATITNTPYQGAEGSSISLTGTGNDPGDNDDAGLTFLWEVDASGIDGGGTCTITNPTSATTASVKCTDDGTAAVKLTVSDDDGGSGTATVNVTVTNATPIVTITSPSLTTGVLFSLLSGPVPVTATYTDAGSNDTHTCQLELVGDIGTVGSYFGVSGGNCTGSILPAQADVYTLIVRVKDDDGAEGSASIMIVVYDPSAGFVTGGGWIQSPAGAYKADVYLTGKATFGFVSKYKKGATVPEGNTEFQFHAGGLNFNSSVYEYLLVNAAGITAQFKGTGTINGQGSYTFMLWATDNGNSGDTFRIKINDNNNAGALVYDNLQPGPNPEQVISGGSIVIHTGSKK